MTEITLKAKVQAHRGPAMRTWAWADLAERWRPLPSFAPMLRLVESVAASPASAQLFPAPSMFELHLSDSPDFRTGDSTLQVAYRPADSVFRFHHHGFSGHGDRQTCSEPEAEAMFWLFVRLKFGVLREKPPA